MLFFFSSFVYSLETVSAFDLPILVTLLLNLFLLFFPLYLSFLILSPLCFPAFLTSSLEAFLGQLAPSL